MATNPDLIDQLAAESGRLVREAHGVEVQRRLERSLYERLRDEFVMPPPPGALRGGIPPVLEPVAAMVDRERLRLQDDWDRRMRDTALRFWEMPPAMPFTTITAPAGDFYHRPEAVEAKKLAQQKAEDLLRQTIRDEDYASLTAHGFIELTGVCWRYRIRRNGMTDLLDSTDCLARACLQLSDPKAPDQDRIVATYILIKNDERRFLSTSNVFWDSLTGQPPPPPPEITVAGCDTNFATYGTITRDTQAQAQQGPRGMDALNVATVRQALGLVGTG